MSSISERYRKSYAFRPPRYRSEDERKFGCLVEAWDREKYRLREQYGLQVFPHPSLREIGSDLFGFDYKTVQRVIDMTRRFRTLRPIATIIPMMRDVA